MAFTVALMRVAEGDMALGLVGYGKMGVTETLVTSLMQGGETSQLR